MESPRRHAWVPAVLLVGGAYFLIGRLFTLPPTHVHAWRLAAWAISGIAYGAHIWYEHVSLRSSARLGAMHVAMGVAIGGFTLAVAGMMHSFSSSSATGPTWLLALILWPAFTAVPAFLGALVAGMILRRLRPNPDEELRRVPTGDG